MSVGLVAQLRRLGRQYSDWLLTVQTAEIHSFKGPITSAAVTTTLGTLVHADQSQTLLRPSLRCADGKDHRCNHPAILRPPGPSGAGRAARKTC
jgi:hypothetical protein